MSFSVPDDWKNSFFDSVALAEYSSTAKTSSADKRTISIQLHEAAGGGYLVAIEIRSSDPSIPRVLEVDHASSSRELEEILYTFDPADYLERPLVADGLEFPRLYAAYDHVVFAVLDTLCDYLAGRRPRRQPDRPPDKARRIRRLESRNVWEKLRWV